MFKFKANKKTRVFSDGDYVSNCHWAVKSELVKMPQALKYIEGTFEYRDGSLNTSSPVVPNFKNVIPQSTLPLAMAATQLVISQRDGSDLCRIYREVDGSKLAAVHEEYHKMVEASHLDVTADSNRQRQTALALSSGETVVGALMPMTFNQSAIETACRFVLGLPDPEEVTK